MARLGYNISKTVLIGGIVVSLSGVALGVYEYNNPQPQESQKSESTLEKVTKNSSSNNSTPKESYPVILTYLGGITAIAGGAGMDLTKRKR